MAWLVAAAWLAVAAKGAEERSASRANPPASEAAAKALLANHRPWVWEAQKNGVTIWLAGCLHLGDAKDLACFPAYLPYFERASAVYFELMPGAWESPEVTGLIQRRGYLTSRQNLADRLSPEAWRSVRETMEGHQETLARIRPMEPWLASLTLNQECYRRGGLSPRFALDDYLTNRALVESKPIGGLEKPKDQILALADADRRDQEHNLLGTLVEYRSGGQGDYSIEAVRSAWRSGDLAQLQHSFGSDAGAQEGETHYNLLARRNQQWMRKIRLMVASGHSALLVVGAEHLVTRTNSLPELLALEGFKVRRVSRE